MIELSLFLAIGLLLLIVLLVWARRSASAAPDGRARAEVLEALSALELAVPPRPLRERIFALEDWEFISNQAAHNTQRLFLKERRRVALSWLRETRKKVGEVIALRRTAVRRDRELRPAVEIKLATDYGFFFLVYVLLHTLIWLGGPFGARRMVGFAANLAEEVSLSTARLLVELDPARFAGMKAEWTRS